MLTPQEVSEHAFPKASFGGYNMASVDDFLDLLTSDYTALYTENAVLKSKMKTLADKVEEYRSTEDAMRKALMAAQRMADELVAEAEQKKADLLRQAEQEAADSLERIHKELANEEYRLTAAQNATAACVLKVRKLYEGQIEFLNSLDQEFPAPKSPQDQAVTQTVQDIEQTIHRILAQEDASEPAQPEAADMSDATTEFFVPEITETEPPADEIDFEPDALEKTAVHHIDFGELQFGKDYEIK